VTSDLARTSVVGGLVLVGLAGGLACWPVAPDSSKDEYLEAGLTDVIVTIEGSIFVDGGVGDDSTNPGDDGSGSSSGGGDGGDAAPLVIVPTPSPAIGAGVAFGCAIDATGAVWCWGNDAYGQAGSTPSSASIAEPQLVAGIANATWIALGDYHACAITASHAVYCWGLNGSYQLGHAAATAGDGICPGAVAGQTVPCNATPALVAGLPPAVAIAAAGTWTCIVAMDGSVQCWGGMQLATSDAGVPCGVGTQATGGSCYPGPTAIAGVTGATLLAVGSDHACAVVAAGSQTDAGNQVACWGKNNEAQVSPSACPQSDCITPAIRSDLPTTTGVLAGNAFTCALASDGSVRCFGDNSYGELGHAPESSGDQGSADLEAGLGVFNPTPVPASATSVASLIGGGNQAACALLASGAAECWGQVTSGGTSTPTAVTGLPVMKALGSYDSAYVCGFAAADGSIWCWTPGSTTAPAELTPSADDAGGPG
jgi:alpha-tubulin suppressor-like RCC1 family protein